MAFADIPPANSNFSQNVCPLPPLPFSHSCSCCCFISSSSINTLPALLTVFFPSFSRFFHRPMTMIITKMCNYSNSSLVPRSAVPTLGFSMNLMYQSMRKITMTGMTSSSTSISLSCSPFLPLGHGSSTRVQRLR